jgi:hypothetical protein
MHGGVRIALMARTRLDAYTRAFGEIDRPLKDFILTDTCIAPPNTRTTGTLFLGKHRILTQSLETVL